MPANPEQLSSTSSTAIRPSVSSTSSEVLPLVRKSNKASRRQGIFWICTVPYHHFVPWLPSGCVWIRGQLERGKLREIDEHGNELEDTGYLHWQFVVAFSEKKSLKGIISVFGKDGHYELTYSEGAADYCHKEDTCIVGTQFELGAKPIDRKRKVEWESIWELATLGQLTGIPASIRVQSYRTIRAISTDYARPLAIEREVNVYWGSTGTGKSRAAWAEAGMDAYPKDPKSKFWCGYRDQQHVVIDEFRGDIDIAHVLRWLDRYPVIVEVKGGAQVFKAKKIWITSNLDPTQWYPTLDSLTYEALMRRIKVTRFRNLNENKKND